MSKRKFDEAFGWPEASSSRREPSKYSLDSDEEDDEDSGENDVLADEDIEGQEEGASGINDGIKITPFNMKEEMEEGHFDTDGMYHWKKETNVKDNWLDNIDWEKVREADKPDKDDADLPDYESSDDSIPFPPNPRFNTIAAYKKMLEYVQPEESVAQALRRLGGSKETSRSDRWKKRKAGLNLTEEEKINQEKFSKLTELADSILNRTGNMNIYQETYDDICYEVNSWEKRHPVKAKKPKKEELDMYADDFGEKEQERLKDSDNALSSSDSDTKEKGGDDTMWEFKVSEDSEIVQGPYNSQYMQNMVTSQDFKGEIWVRKSNSDGQFYSSRRVDFDLYF